MLEKLDMPAIIKTAGAAFALTAVMQGSRYAAQTLLGDTLLTTTIEMLVASFALLVAVGCGVMYVTLARTHGKWEGAIGGALASLGMVAASTLTLPLLPLDLAIDQLAVVWVVVGCLLWGMFGMIAAAGGVMYTLIRR